MATDELERMQKTEITEYIIYSDLAKKAKGKNRETLELIAQDERKHYSMLKEVTGKEVGPDRLKVLWYTAVSQIFGLSFGLKLMEGGEQSAQTKYTLMIKSHPDLAAMLKDEERHELELINLIKDERLDYAGAVVLGLNDAIVEFTGTIAGLTFAVGDGKIIGITGVILGVAASLSMAVSSYMSAKEEAGKDPAKAFFYTGAAYMLTVMVMISPYFLLPDAKAALLGLLLLTFVIIAIYSFYVSVAKEKNFMAKFTEMAGISLGVAAVSFAMGLILKTQFGIVT